MCGAVDDIYDIVDELMCKSDYYCAQNDVTGAREHVKYRDTITHMAARMCRTYTLHGVLARVHLARLLKMIGCVALQFFCF